MYLTQATNETESILYTLYENRASLLVVPLTGVIAFLPWSELVLLASTLDAQTALIHLSICLFVLLS